MGQVAWRFGNDDSIVGNDPELLASARKAIEELRRQQRLGVKWMLTHIANDGEPVGQEQFNSYYRVPWTLALCGEREAAASVLSWVERHALDKSGDLLSGAPQKPFTVRTASYALAQLALGAWHLERYDTARRIMEVLQRYQDPDTGGGYIERPECRSTGKQDILLTGQLGLTALTTGRRQVADAAYKWFAALYKAQPELPRRLFSSWDVKGLVTDYTAETAWGTVTDFQLSKQQFFNPGIASAFLGRYYMATDEKPALDLAEKFIELTAKGDELQWNLENAQICKFAWGAAVLLEITQKRRYLEYLLRMVRWYADMQEPAGNWHASPFLVPNPTPANDLPKTAEHTLHVTTMLTALAGFQR